MVERVMKLVVDVESSLLTSFKGTKAEEKALHHKKRTEYNAIRKAWTMNADGKEVTSDFSVEVPGCICIALIAFQVTQLMDPLFEDLDKLQISADVDRMLAVSFAMWLRVHL